MTKKSAFSSFDENKGKKIKCSGNCGEKIYKNPSTYNRCYNCYNELYSTVKCERCPREILKSKKKTHCDDCLENELSENYMHSLINTYGPVEEDYVIQFNIKGTGYIHTGYSCYTPDDTEEVELDEYICLPLFTSTFLELKTVTDELNTQVDIKKFYDLLNDNENFYDKFPNFSYYLTLNLCNINYSDTCDCRPIEESDDKPHIVSLSIIENKNRTKVTTFYSMTKKEPYYY